MNYKLVKRHRALKNLYRHSFVCNGCKKRLHIKFYAGDFMCIDCVIKHITQTVANGKELMGDDRVV